MPAKKTGKAAKKAVKKTPAKKAAKSTKKPAKKSGVKAGAQKTNGPVKRGRKVPANPSMGYKQNDDENLIDE